MTACSQDAPAPLRCPTLQESVDATLKLLPQGRAWQSSDGPLRNFPLTAFDPAAFDPAAFDTGKPGTVLVRFWAAVGAVRNYVESRLCDLRLEFWCATHKETHPEWMREYGLPDACDPFPDLCTKVAALGGARCEYFSEVVARLGWSITCDDGVNQCGGMAGAALAGCDEVGSVSATKLRILVDTGDSSAYQGDAQTPPLAGLIEAGMPLSCAPDITALQCLMDRIAPAHVQVDYIIQ